MNLPPYIYGREAGPNEEVWTEAAVREAVAAKDIESSKSEALMRGRMDSLETEIARLRLQRDDAVAAAVPDAQEGKRFQAKFNIGDHVWYMKNNAPTEVVISAIEVFLVNTNQDRITYNAKNVKNSVSWLDHTKLHEAWLFKSKTELLESL